MIVDLQPDGALPQFSADICIVGAGAAGIVLMQEFVRQGKRVLLLESGGESIEDAAQSLNECTYEGQPHRGANVGRFRAVGGTTTVWGGQVLELNAEDFAERSWVAGSGWPFSKEELIPYYRRALQAEGLEQCVCKDDDVWRATKIAAPHMGNALETYFTRWCPEPNFAGLYRKTFESANVCLVLHATAIEMLMSEDGSSVQGISCKTFSGKEQTFSATQYIFCVGTIETVRFLLQPLPGGHTPRWNRSGLLGRHFQSHIDMNAASIPVENVAVLQQWFANVYRSGYKYHPKFRLAFPLQQRDKVLNVGGSITCINPAEAELRRVKSLIRDFLHGHFFGTLRTPGAALEDFPRVLRQLPAMLRLAYEYRVHHRAAWPRQSTFWLRTHCEQEPLSRSQITLTNVRDAMGLLQARLDWHVSPIEWKTIRCFAEQVNRAFATLGAGKIILRGELALEEGFSKITFDDSHHHMGGTRMAVSSADGVVTPDLRLHGVENAYVCSASVFPTSGFSNPTHTLIALSIRLADHLKGAARA